jgi:hypothetical protein
MASEITPALNSCHTAVVTATANRYSTTPLLRPTGPNPQTQIGIHRNPPTSVLWIDFRRRLKPPLASNSDVASNPKSTFKPRLRCALPSSACHSQRLRTSPQSQHRDNANQRTNRKQAEGDPLMRATIWFR